MKKLSKYQKAYLWNHKKDTRKDSLNHKIIIWASETEAYTPRQMSLSNKHLLLMRDLIGKDHHSVVVATESNKDFANILFNLICKGDIL